MSNQAQFEKEKIILIDGVEYVRKDSLPADKQPGSRAVVVLDRGWIFAGDVTEKDGRIYLSRAVWLFRWESIGFSKAVAESTNPKVDIRPIADVDLPVGAEIFRVPVDANWGLK